MSTCSLFLFSIYLYVYLSIHLLALAEETKIPTIWTDKKQSQEEAEPGRNSDAEKVRREKIRDGESQKTEDAGARKGGKVPKRCVFLMFCGSGGSKSRLAKAAGAEAARQMKDKKLHAVVARSTCASQNVQTKHLRVGALLEVKLSKECTSSWREAHIESCSKLPHIRSTFGS